jgi:hypothetical protein
VIEEDGLRFEILESTKRKVQRVRISVPQPKVPEQKQMKLI